MQSTRYVVTSCHGNDDEMWSTSCLIIQHKPYIVEQPQPLLLSLHKSMQVCMSSFSVLGHSLVIYRWHISNNIMLFHSVSVMASRVCTVAKRVVKCAGMLLRVCVRVPSYETDDRDMKYIV